MKFFEWSYSWIFPRVTLKTTSNWRDAFQSMTPALTLKLKLWFWTWSELRVYLGVGFNVPYVKHEVC